MKRFLLVIVLLTAATASAQGSEKDAARTYVEKGYFSVAIPAGWEKEGVAFGLSQGEKRVYGADFVAAGGGEGPAPRISVHYYAQGNLLHRTAAHFIRRHAEPVLGAAVDGESYGPVKDGRVGSSPAKVFERRVFPFLPPHAIQQKKIPLDERFAVVPAKVGFYVLRLSSTEEASAASAKAYESVLASFKPLAR